MGALKLSIVIPAHNEEGSIETTVRALYQKLRTENINHEILVVNDNSADQTEALLKKMATEISTLRYLNNSPPNGFGFAVRKGLDNFSGDAVAVYMADASDSPNDLVKFFRVMQSTNVDCVFGTRFSRTSRLVDYPRVKHLLNRMANNFIRILFRLRYNDITNAFKMYRKHVISGLKPFLSHHFNLTVELPLKSIIRGYTYAIVPNDWVNRKAGESKLKIKEMGSRYLFIILYCFIEKWFSRGDYHREKAEASLEKSYSPPAKL